MAHSTSYDPSTLGLFWDEKQRPDKKSFAGHPATRGQLEGYGAPRVAPHANEQELFAESMRIFPDIHPSLGSVSNAADNKAVPALLFPTEHEFVSTYQAEVCEKRPTEPKRPEGKKFVRDQGELPNMFKAPQGRFNPPPIAPAPMVNRDARVLKHMGTLTRQGNF